MQTFELEWEKFSKAVDNLSMVSKRYTEVDFLKKRAGGLLYRIKSDTPFRTGALQGSLRKAKDGLGKFAKFSMAKNRKLADAGFYREKLGDDDKTIEFGTYVKYGYVLNAGYREYRNKKGTLVKQSYPQHKGWFDTAIAKETQWVIDQYYKELKKQKLNFI
jgi:hypothetical protein